jgi:hypothetical protein
MMTRTAEDDKDGRRRQRHQELTRTPNDEDAGDDKESRSSPAAVGGSSDTSSFRWRHLTASHINQYNTYSICKLLKLTSEKNC